MKLNKYCICLYSKVVYEDALHTNRHQEAKLLPPDTFLSRKNAQKTYSTHPDPLAGNGGGPPPGKGREKERWGGEG